MRCSRPSCRRRRARLSRSDLPLSARYEPNIAFPAVAGTAPPRAAFRTADGDADGDGDANGDADADGVADADADARTPGADEAATAAPDAAGGAEKSGAGAVAAASGAAGAAEHAAGNASAASASSRRRGRPRPHGGSAVIVGFPSPVRGRGGHVRLHDARRTPAPRSADRPARPA
ncbi:hypothetical protein DMB66_46900 [Actinoplanes sp. ATCC 53533]|nr:hypothetical protein DMB66_46900 [Actinoplanes sp. ATCC 53533]